MAEAIDTVGEVVSEEPIRPAKVEAKEIPVYTVARAVEWMKRPENQVKVEKAAKIAGEYQREVARHIDREVTQVGRLLVNIATDESVENDFINSFLQSIIGDD